MAHIKKINKKMEYATEMLRKYQRYPSVIFLDSCPFMQWAPSSVALPGASSIFFPLLKQLLLLVLLFISIESFLDSRVKGQRMPFASQTVKPTKIM